MSFINFLVTNETAASLGGSNKTAASLGGSNGDNKAATALSSVALVTSAGVIVVLGGKTLVTKIQGKKTRLVFLYDYDNEMLFSFIIDIVQIVKLILKL